MRAIRRLAEARLALFAELSLIKSSERLESGTRLPPWQELFWRERPGVQGLEAAPSLGSILIHQDRVRFTRMGSTASSMARARSGSVAG
ncbi:hypothetical protein D9M72_118770 [compost metagenome]